MKPCPPPLPAPTRCPILPPALAALLLLATAATAPAGAPAGPRVYDVKTFGAAGDGRAIDTRAINEAVAAAAAAGGGTVEFPAGTYPSLSVHLRSNVTLQLDAGAVLVAADTADGAGYDPAEPNPAAGRWQDFGHTHFHNSLLWGEDLENVSIVGPGLIYGRGLSRGGMPKKHDGPATVPAVVEESSLRESRRPDAAPGERDALPDGVGNKAIALKNCRNVTLRDVSILQGGHFGILATGVDNLTIDNLKIDTNRDGMDVDCCRNVRISNCSVNSPWDDGICLKSSYGLGLLRATENVTITNCYVAGGYEMGTLLSARFQKFPADKKVPHTGRIKFGTESNGGFKNITISNCLFDDCGGLAIESVDGGVIEDVTVSNLAMRDIVSCPIFIRLGSRLRGPDNPPVGAIRRVNISDVVVRNAAGRYGSIITGTPGHPVEDLRLSNLQIVQDGGGAGKDAAPDPPEKEDAYPEPTMFGPMPSSAFFARHVVGLEMHHVDVSYLHPDPRPAIVLRDVSGADFDHVRARREAGAPFFRLQKARDFVAHNCPGLADTRRDNAEDESL